MTLIVLTANSDQVLVVADRLISIAGKPYDDNVTKLTYVRCSDARLCLAYSGLAGVGLRKGHMGPASQRGFRTVEWIADTLIECAKAGSDAGGVVDRFADTASATFATRGVRHDLQGVIFAFAGYRHRGNQPEHFLRVMTNLEDDAVTLRPRFVTDADPDPPPAYMLALGVRSGLDETRRLRLAKAVEDRKPLPALRSLTIDLVVNAARSPASRGLVGDQASAFWIPRAPLVRTGGSFHPNKVTNAIPMVHQVDLRGGPDGAMAILDAIVVPGFVAVPKVRRNQPCPCGSGRRYRECHGGPMREAWSIGTTAPGNGPPTLVVMPAPQTPVAKTSAPDSGSGNPAEG